MHGRLWWSAAPSGCPVWPRPRIAAFCVTPRLPPAAAGQHGMAEQYHGDDGKRAPQVWTECAQVQTISANSGFGHSGTPSPTFPSPPLPARPLSSLLPFPQGPHPINQLVGLGERWGCPSRQTIWCITEPKGVALVATVFVHFRKNKFKFLYKHKTV